MSTVQNMNNTTTFQHAPYGYNAVPEKFRTIQTPPRSPPTATESLGAMTAQSSMSSFEVDESTPPQKIAGACQPHYLLPPVQHHRPASLAVTSHSLAASRTHSIISNNACVYDQSQMASTTPPPPSYALGMLTKGNSATTTHGGTTPKFLPHDPERPQHSSSRGATTHNGAMAQSASPSPSFHSGTSTPKSTAASSASPHQQEGVSFKAHHHLERAGLPYHEFPLGGNLPTPRHWPQHCTIDGSAEYPNTYRAFIGQVRFETTTEQIAWVIEQMSGVTAAFVAYHRNGCFVAHFFTQQECDLAVGHHKKILFDLNGVWDLAATGHAEYDAHKALAVSQVLRNKPNLHKHRLPRGCMVIEPFASTRNGGGIPTFPHHQNKQHQSAHQQYQQQPAHFQQQYPQPTYQHQQFDAQSNVCMIVPSIVHRRDNSNM